MERATDALLSELRRDGHARLDDLSFRLAAAVAGDIVGLTESDARADAAHAQVARPGDAEPLE
jgi:hypothetical protein